MKAFRCGDQYFGHMSFLPCSFGSGGIAIAHPDLPLHAQACYHFIHSTGNIFCQCPKRCDPKQLQPVVFPGLIFLRVLIDILYDCPEKNRKRFTVTGRCIYQPGISCLNLFPGLLLKKERLAIMCV